MGRPSDFTQELADEICARLADGDSLRTVCNSEDMPDKSTVFRWIRQNEIFRDQYARAKQESADAFVEEISDLADDEPRYTTNKWGADVVDNGYESYRKTRIDTRKWLASKLKPKRYGDKLELAGDPNAPLKTVARVELVSLDE